MLSVIDADCLQWSPLKHNDKSQRADKKKTHSSQKLSIYAAAEYEPAWVWEQRA